MVCQKLRQKLHQNGVPGQGSLEESNFNCKIASTKGHHLEQCLNPAWLMISSGIVLPNILGIIIIAYNSSISHNPEGESRSSPTNCEFLLAFPRPSGNLLVSLVPTVASESGIPTSDQQCHCHGRSMTF